MLPSLIRRVVTQFLNITGDNSEKAHDAYTRKVCAAIKACCPGVLRFATQPTVKAINKVASESVNAHGLAIAIALEDQTLVHYYLHLGVPIWKQTWAFDSPMVIAGHKGNIEILRILLEEGGTKKHLGIRQGKSFGTVISNSIEQEAWDIAVMLLDWRMQHLRIPEWSEFRNWFFQAIQPTAKNLLDRILEYDSSSATNGSYLQTLNLRWDDLSSAQRHLAASLLIKKGLIDLNRYYPYQLSSPGSFLAFAVRQGDIGIVVLCLEGGANPNGVMTPSSKRERPALAEGTRAPVRTLLLDHGAHCKMKGNTFARKFSAATDPAPFRPNGTGSS
jgi:hypothetical protein